MKSIWVKLLILLVAASLLAGCKSPSGPDFAIYLVAPGISAGEALYTPLEDLKIRKEALLTMEDVAAYQPDRYALVLTEEAAARLRVMAVPMDGLPFVVTVKGERIYQGAFWTPLSSMSYEGIAAATLPGEEDGVLTFELGYPASPELFAGQDLRNDTRILEAFLGAGKLAGSNE